MSLFAAKPEEEKPNVEDEGEDAPHVRFEYVHFIPLYSIARFLLSLSFNCS